MIPPGWTDDCRNATLHDSTQVRTSAKVSLTSRCASSAVAGSRTKSRRDPASPAMAFGVASLPPPSTPVYESVRYCPAGVAPAWQAAHRSVNRGPISSFQLKQRWVVPDSGRAFAHATTPKSEATSRSRRPDPDTPRMRHPIAVLVLALVLGVALSLFLERLDVCDQAVDVLRLELVLVRLHLLRLAVLGLLDAVRDRVLHLRVGGVLPEVGRGQIPHAHLLALLGRTLAVLAVARGALRLPGAHSLLVDLGGRAADGPAGQKQTGKRAGGHQFPGSGHRRLSLVGTLSMGVGGRGLLRGGSKACAVEVPPQSV